MAATDDFQLQHETLVQILGVLDDAAALVRTGAPRWVDPDVFGGTRRAERMARHTLGAQSRVYEALDLALEALAQHHGALLQLQDDVEQVEDDAVERTAALRARLGASGTRGDLA